MAHRIKTPVCPAGEFRWAMYCLTMNVNEEYFKVMKRFKDLAPERELTQFEMSLITLLAITNVFIENHGHGAEYKNFKGAFFSTGITRLQQITAHISF